MEIKLTSDKWAKSGKSWQYINIFTWCRFVVCFLPWKFQRDLSSILNIMDGGEERREFRMPCNSIFDGLWQFEVLSFLAY